MIKFSYGLLFYLMFIRKFFEKVAFFIVFISKNFTVCRIKGSVMEYDRCIYAKPNFYLIFQDKTTLVELHWHRISETLLPNFDFDNEAIR